MGFALDELARWGCTCDGSPVERRRFASFVLAAALSLPACSTQSWYDAVRASRMRECNKLPVADRAECLRRVQPDYDTYERERGGAANAQAKN